MCSEFEREELIDFVAGELAPHRERALISHLEQCLSCRAEVALDRRLLAPRSVALAAAPSESRGLKRLRLSPSMAAALVGLALASGYWIGSVAPPRLARQSLSREHRLERAREGFASTPADAVAYVAVSDSAAGPVPSGR